MTERLCAERAEILSPFSSAARSDAKRIVEQRDAVEIPGLAEQLAAPVWTIGSDVLESELRRFLHTPLKRLVGMADELDVGPETDVAILTTPSDQPTRRQRAVSTRSEL